MKRFFGLVLPAVSLGLGGCASSSDSNPGGSSRPGPWEYRTVTLEGATVGLINNQLNQLGLQGWQPVNQYLNVTRSGIGYRATIPLRRWRQ